MFNTLKEFFDVLPFNEIVKHLIVQKIKIRNKRFLMKNEYGL